MSVLAFFISLFISMPQRVRFPPPRSYSVDPRGGGEVLDSPNTSQVVVVIAMHLNATATPYKVITSYSPEALPPICYVICEDIHSHSYFFLRLPLQTMLIFEMSVMFSVLQASVYIFQLEFCSVFCCFVFAYFVFGKCYIFTYRYSLFQPRL